MDFVIGFSKFKNGNVVDIFENNGIVDRVNDQYRCSNDIKNSHNMPPITRNKVDLEEANETEEERAQFDYYVNNKNIVIY